MSEHQDAVIALWKQNKSKREIGRLLGIDESKVRRVVLRWQAEGVRENIAPPTVTKEEIRDSSFWKKKFQESEKEADELSHLIKEFQGLSKHPIKPPTWITSQDNQASHSTIIGHTSDVHMGEVVEPDEVAGSNGYNPEIARERMRRYFDALCTIPFRWLHDSHCDGVLLTMGGDLTSGDIHAELSATNSLTGHEQLAAVVEAYVAGIRQLLEHYPRVHVNVVPGNHGRTTHKPQAKRSGSMSYDTLAGAMVQARINDPRVTFDIASGPDIWTPVYGRGIVTTHGDRMGTGGGMGFAGPILPVVRGGFKVKQQYLSLGKPCDLILSGHFHFSAAPPGMLANGSMVGASEYGYGLRFALDGPRQWIARFSNNWGLCERLDVQL